VKVGQVPSRAGDGEGKLAITGEQMPRQESFGKAFGPRLQARGEHPFLDCNLRTARVLCPFSPGSKRLSRT